MSSVASEPNDVETAGNTDGSFYGRWELLVGQPLTVAQAEDLLADLGSVLTLRIFERSPLALYGPQIGEDKEDARNALLKKFGAGVANTPLFFKTLSTKKGEGYDSANDSLPKWQQAAKVIEDEVARIQTALGAGSSEIWLDAETYQAALLLVDEPGPLEPTFENSLLLSFVTGGGPTAERGRKMRERSALPGQGPNVMQLYSLSQTGGGSSPLCADWAQARFVER